MNAQEIINLWRELSFYTDTSEYTDAKALTDLNITYRDVVAQVNQDVNEDLYATDFYTSSVAGQMEYTLPQTDNSTGTNWMDNLLGVFINYEVPVAWTGTIATSIGSATITGTNTLFTSQFQIWWHIIFNSDFYRVVSIASDTSMTIAAVDTALPASNASGISFEAHKTNYLKCYPQRLSNLDQDQTYYQNNTNIANPIYIKYDTGIRIYPLATQTVVWAVKLYGTYDVADLVLSPAPTTPIIDNNWHYILAFGMKRFSFQRRGMLNEAGIASNEFAIELRKMINTLSDSELSPLVRIDPLLTELQ